MNNERRFIHMVENSSPNLAKIIKDARIAAGQSQEQAAATLGLSQPTYSRIETGERPTKGHELILLADSFHMRVSTLVNLPDVASRSVFAARTDGSRSAMSTMKRRLCEYLELDSYLAEAGIPGA